MTSAAVARRERGIDVDLLAQAWCSNAPFRDGEIRSADPRTQAAIDALVAAPGMDALRSVLSSDEAQRVIARVAEGGPFRPFSVVEPDALDPLTKMREVFALTDAGNAECFAARHGDSVRFVHGWGRWLLRARPRWALDDRGEVRELMVETVRHRFAEAALAEDLEERKRITKHALASERRDRIMAALDLASSKAPIASVPDDLDRDPLLFNVENGTIDLSTGRLRPHDPADLITKLARVAYDPAATAPRWEAFLRQVIPDAAVREYLQRAVGYGLTGSVAEHVLFFLFGTGRNGKSTFLEVLLELLGDYAKAAPHNLLLATKQDRHAAEIATLMGFRFVTAVEAGEGRSWDEAKVKHLTGGDTVSARWMHGNPFTFKPSHKFWVAANHKPRVTGTDLGFWRRVHLIPWTVTIPEEDVDKNLSAKLRAELPGILRWAVEGCVAWQREGLRPPPAVVAATKDYRSGEDVIGAFLDDRCIREPAGRVVSSVLYRVFREWVEANGERHMTARAFGDALEERGLERKKANGQRWIVGVSLRQDEARDAA
jgi:putative DNA primase/helicase